MSSEVRSPSWPPRAGAVFGWVFASHQIGAAVAASAAGFPRTELGN